jgi:tRNA G18 (ribose-2'-O)-methylase SpoU
MGAAMIVPIDSLDDPRVADYRNLKDRELARHGGKFVAEGEMVVCRLLASDLKTDSLLVSRRRVDEIAPLAPPDVPVYVASDDRVVQSILGFKYHSGVIAVGRRPATKTLDELVADRSKPLLLVICPDLISPLNLGGVIRIFAAFGATGMIIGEKSCDPFFRQSVRVSMGAVFKLPILQSKDLLHDLKRLREEFNVELIATVLDADAEALSKARASGRVGVLFGNEAHGLSREIVEACNRKVTIPMQLGTDSLNVAVSAAVTLYHFTSAAPLSF